MSSDTPILAAARAATAAAILDRRAALDRFQSDPEYVAWRDERRARLAHTVEVRGGSAVHFHEAEPHPSDPPGTVRYVVIQPDGTRRPPKGRIAGETVVDVEPATPDTGKRIPFDDDDEPYPRGPLSR